jgi:hypothetical protein
MPSGWLRVAALSACLMAADAAELRGQAGLGQLEDATVAPRGHLRLRAMTVWTRFDSRFAAEGVERLGAPFTSDSLGRRQIAALAEIDSLLSSALARPFALSLGQSRLDARGRHEIVPVGIEYGLTDRLTVGVIVPLVRRRVAVQFRLDSAGATVGPNLHRTLPGAQTNNALVQSQFQAAAAQLQSRLQSCQANPSGAGCGALLDRQTEAQQLILASQGFASDIAALYGGGSSGGMAFVPTAQSAAQAEISLRVADFNSRYRSLLGSNSDLITAVPTPAGGPAGTSEVQRYLTTDLDGDSLATEERTGFGDVELGIKALLLDRSVTEERRFSARAAMVAAVRIPTGSRQSPSPVADLRLGEGLLMMDGRFVLDLEAGRLGLLSSGELTAVLEGKEESGGDTRWTGLHLQPRVHLAAPFAVHGAYSVRSANRSGSEQLVGGGVSFSTLSAYRAGGPLPLEMRYTHLESLRGQPGHPKFFRDQIEFRIYYPVRR